MKLQLFFSMNTTHNLQINTLKDIQMKVKKVISAITLSVLLGISTCADAGSVGRSGGGFSSSRSYSSSSSFSKPSSSYSSPSKSSSSSVGGIGGTGSSVGVRKSEVTNGVKADIAKSSPSTSSHSGSSGWSSSSSSHYSSPSYNSNTSSGVTNSSTFMSSLGGSFVGSALGNMIFGGNHGSSGTTVINNGGGGSVGGSASPNAGQPALNSDGFTPGIAQTYKKEYTVWNFIGDVIGFTLLLALLGVLVWAIYKGIRAIINYIKKEHGVSNIPFNPTQRFWEIQRAFASADVESLQSLLGPDVVDELTSNLQPQQLTLYSVSHEVRLQNSREFSIWYKFLDGTEDVNQVWHYEKFGKEWKLNGIENF